MSSIKLHILGGSYGQLNVIKRAREMGLYTIVSDLNSAAPGMAMADAISSASTFDSEKVREDAEVLGSTAFLAAGTDQPVLTAARAAEALGIPYFLTHRTAELVTNKKKMKEAYRNLGIPTSPFRFYSRTTPLSALQGLKSPLVIKPLDSQGQRGVLKLDSAEEIPGILEKVLSFSREDEVLIEEYYPSREVTVTGWVKEGRYTHLTTTDRITRDNLPSIGVCPAHHFPSVFSRYEQELISLTERIVEGFGIPEGPIYFQCLVGEDGVKINESACRLGGAYEDEFIPWITGVDILDLMIKMSCGIGYSLDEYDIINGRKEKKYVSLQMFFYEQGELIEQAGMKEILEMDGILGGRFLLKKGTTIGNRENSTQRAGYFIASGRSAGEVNRLTCRAFDKLTAWDSAGKNLLAGRPVLLSERATEHETS